MCHRNWFYYDLRVCTELGVLSKTVSRLWYYAYKKYKNSSSARRTSTQHHIQLSICFGGSDNFSSGISRKLPKIATSNVVFLRAADRIAAKFCMTIKKIKPNDIFQNCVHSTSTLTLAVTFESFVEIEASYLACILKLRSPFKWKQGQWDLVSFAALSIVFY